jgi:hypothetical protein
MAGWAAAIVGTLALTFVFFCFLCYVLGLKKSEAITTAVYLATAIVVAIYTFETRRDAHPHAAAASSIPRTGH